MPLTLCPGGLGTSAQADIQVCQWSNRYASGATASDSIVLIQELYNLIGTGTSSPPSLLSVTIQIQGSPENESQGIRRVKINLHAPGCDANSRPLGVAQSRSVSRAE